MVYIVIEGVQEREGDLFADRFVRLVSCIMRWDTAFRPDLVTHAAAPRKVVADDNHSADRPMGHLNENGFQHNLRGPHDDRTSARPGLGEGAHTVHLCDVHKSYWVADRSFEILHGVNLDVYQGETIVIRGISGSGKSTLLNLIGAIDQVTKGTLDVCGSRLSDLNPSQLTTFRREKVGFIFQFYNLIPTLTALENVMAALEAARVDSARASKVARDYLHAVGLSDMVDKFPEQLSGGEQQRVAIARAVAKEPPLVLADEPTGNLDEENGSRVLELLKGLTKRFGATVMIVTHDPQISQYADRTVLLRDGKLVL